MKKRLLILSLLLLILISVIFGCCLTAFVHVEGKDTFVENVDMPSNTGVDNHKEKESVQEEIIEEPSVLNIKLLAVGDLMFHMPQINAAKTNSGEYDFSSSFKHVKKYIEGVNIATGNFETVTAGNDLGFSGFPRFNSPKQTLLALKDSGFDIISTANNHSLDQGQKGIINTIDAIEFYGLKNIGTYKDQNRQLLIEDVNGIKVGFISYTERLNGLEGLLSAEHGFMVNRMDERLIEEDIKNLKEQEVDLIVVYSHWGDEYHKEPSQHQIDLGRKMIAWGANIILGSHPHVVQRAEIIEFEGKDNLIVYSMGNFLSNQRYETMGNSSTEDGVMVEIELEKDISTVMTTIKEIRCIPTWVYRYKDSIGLHYEILPIEDVLLDNSELQLSDSILERIRKSYDTTMSTFNIDK